MMHIKIKEELVYYKYLCLNFINRFRYPVKVFSTVKTLDTIAKQKCSIARFGDGEFDLIFGQDLKFQKYDMCLASKLKDILSGAENNQSCKVAIPCAFAHLNGLTRSSKKFWSVYWGYTRSKIYGLLNPAYHYFDAQVTRIYVNRKHKTEASFYFQKWKEIWKDEDVLLVEGQYSRFGVGNDLFDEAKSVERILCPASNAFDYYNEILEAITRYGKQKLVLLVLGPTATALAYDLDSRGIWAIDSGNLDMEYEWSKRQAKKQVAINGKYTHEADNGTNVSVVDDKKYYAQIIAQIGI